MRYKYSFELISFGKYKEVKEEIKEPRPIGFYWVKHDGMWTVAEWIENGWYFLGDIGLMRDEHFDKILEEQIQPPKI